jgi:hypothetical protein
VKRKFREMYITAIIYFTRPDICHKHWVKKIKVRETSEDKFLGGYKTETLSRCTVCRDEEEVRQQEMTRRITQSEDSFLKELEALRKAYDR